MLLVSKRALNVPISTRKEDPLATQLSPKPSTHILCVHSKRSTTCYLAITLTLLFSFTLAFSSSTFQLAFLFLVNSNVSQNE